MARTLLVLITCCVPLFGCSETSKTCFDQEDATMTHRVSACGELCEIKDDADACEKQVELANAACFEEGEVEVCDWMCKHAQTGKDVYCKKHEELNATQPAP